MATAAKLVTTKDALELQRKTFVRDYCIRAERRRQNYKPRRSKNREEEQIRQTIRDVIDEVVSVDQWRLQFVLNANRAWEKRLIREWVNQAHIFSYEDLKTFVQA